MNRFEFNKPKIERFEPDNIATPIPDIGLENLDAEGRPDATPVEPIDPERPDLREEVGELDAIDYPAADVLVNNFIRAKEAEEAADTAIDLVAELIINSDNDLGGDDGNINTCNHLIKDQVEELTGSCILTPCTWQCIVDVALRGPDKVAGKPPKENLNTENKIVSELNKIQPLSFGLLFLLLLIRIILAFAVQMILGSVCKLLKSMKQKMSEATILGFSLAGIATAIFCPPIKLLKYITNILIELLGFKCRGIKTGSCVDDEVKGNECEETSDGVVTITFDCCPDSTDTTGIRDRARTLFNSECLKKAVNQLIRKDVYGRDPRPICSPARCKQKKTPGVDYGIREITLAQEVVKVVARQTKNTKLLGMLETVSRARSEAIKSSDVIQSINKSLNINNFDNATQKKQAIDNMFSEIEKVPKCDFPTRVADLIFNNIIRSQVVLVVENPDAYVRAVEEKIGSATRIFRNIKDLGQDLFELVTDPKAKFRAELLGEAANAIRELRLRYDQFVDGIPILTAIPGINELLQIQNGLRDIENTLRNG